MRKAKQKQSRLIILVLTFVIFVSSIGLWSYRSDDFETVKNLDIFYTLYKELSLYYVDDVDAGKAIKTGIDAMLQSLDPYTVYIPETQIEDLRFMTTGQYGGIGALIRQYDEYVVIAEPYENFPAYDAGLKAGDVILEIDGKSTKDKKSSEISELLKGQPNTSVIIKIERYGEGKPREVELTRKEVQVPNVPYSGIIGEGIAYVTLNRFTSGASNDVKNAIIELKKENEIKGIIIDLRNNPGGLLMEAVFLSNLFIEKDKEIVSTKGKVAEWDKVYKAPTEAFDKTTPLVILVNRGSASASEIVSGAVQDYDRGVIIGERTFGKGLVQTTRELSYNAKLKVTTAKYYIPSGRCIQALDYSNRNEDGSVGRVPDSLATEFSTAGGRKVFDGGGILPDIEIEMERASNIAIALIIQNILFDYATKFVSENDSISSPETFSISNEQYKDFVAYVLEKEFVYDTKSEETLNDLIEITKKEKYFEEASNNIEALKIVLAHDVEKDLSVFREEVIEMLESEIIGRYYYQKGRIKYSLKLDKEIEKAIEVLQDTSMYKQILSTNE
jgi:carboxyl-terminal processing protease